MRVSQPLRSSDSGRLPAVPRQAVATARDTRPRVPTIVSAGGSTMAQGTVKWFNADRGFVFIAPTTAPPTSSWTTQPSRLTGIAACRTTSGSSSPSPRALGPAGRGRPPRSDTPAQRRNAAPNDKPRAGRGGTASPRQPTHSPQAHAASRCTPGVQALQNLVTSAIATDVGHANLRRSVLGQTPESGPLEAARTGIMLGGRHVEVPRRQDHPRRCPAGLDEGEGAARWGERRNYV